MYLNGGGAYIWIWHVYVRAGGLIFGGLRYINNFQSIYQQFWVSNINSVLSTRFAKVWGVTLCLKPPPYLVCPCIFQTVTKYCNVFSTDKHFGIHSCTRICPCRYQRVQFNDGI